VFAECLLNHVDDTRQTRVGDLVQDQPDRVASV
jgi:hypothetical protein